MVTAERLLVVLVMRPSTTIKGVALLTTPLTTTLVLGPYLIPNYRYEDHKQAQTPVDTIVSLLLIHLARHGHPTQNQRLK